MRNAVVFAVLASALVLAGAGAGSVVTGSVTANPLVVTLTVSPAQLVVGGRATATATVRNLGTQPLAAAATLQLESTGLALAGDATQQLGTIAGGGTGTASWEVCGVKAGNYVLVAQAAGGNFNAASDAALLSVTQAAGSCDMQPSTPGCAAGAGALTASKSFAFAASYVRGQPGPTGVVGYEDNGAKVKLASIRLTSFVLAGNRVTIRGTGLANRATVAFRLDAQDVRGGRDTFAIEWPGYSAAGALANGDVVLSCTKS